VTEKTPLYLVKPDAELVPMKPSAPATEDELQALIARYPQLIGDSDGSLLLIEREVGVPAAADAAPRWSIDHLYVTRQAVPVLVEVKRAVDTRLRREVVGQMLDYAANGVAYWPAGSIAARFEALAVARGEDSAEALADFLGDHEKVGSFWGQVDANLRAGRIKLVFVADEIPLELARIVEFLNDQMRADVRAVELTYFDGPEGSRMLAPRIIGETAQSQIAKTGERTALPAISVDEWIDTYLARRGEAVLVGAHELVAAVGSLVDGVVVAQQHGWLDFQVGNPQKRASHVFYALSAGILQIGFGSLGAAASKFDDALRERFYARFNEAIGPLSTKNLRGAPAFPLDRLADPAKREAFLAIARDFVGVCRS
jgi:hypothetical protein